MGTLSWLDPMVVVQSAGVALPTRAAVNIIGATSVVDNPAANRVDVTVGGGGTAPTGTGWYHATLSAMDAAAVTMGDSAIVAGAFVIAMLSSAAAIPVTTALSFGANPSATGVVRLANVAAIKGRNAANSADMSLLFLDAANQLQIGDSTNAGLTFTSGGPVIARGTTFQIQPSTGGTNAWQFTGLSAASNTALTVDANMLTPTITQAATGNASGAAFTFTAQNALTNGGNMVFQTGTGSANTTSGWFLFNHGQARAAQLKIWDQNSTFNWTELLANTLLLTSSAGNLTITANANVVLAGGNTTGLTVASGSNVGIGNGSTSFGGGSGVMFLLNAVTAPTSNPTGGIILYSVAGALSLRSAAGPAGTWDANKLTTLGGIRRAVRRIAASATLVATDDVVMFTANAQTATLPASPTAGDKYTVGLDVATGTYTIASNGGAINILWVSTSGTSITINVTNTQAVTCMYDGSVWVAAVGY